MGILEQYFGLAGKTVLVTGGGRGIGESIAEGFVKAGAMVYICSRKAETCAATAERLSAFGTCIALPVAADISTEAGRRAVVEAMGEREDKLDVLINNAGALWAAPLAEYPESGWDKVFDLNVKGLFFLIRDLVPLLEAAASKAEPARIINIGSIDGFHIPKHETYAYSSSKAASHQLSIHLADQLAGRNITVNVIAPGMFPSKMMQGTLDRVGEEKVVEKVPMKRLTGADDMAGTAMFLASHAASYITGVVLPVDGGTATTL
ncbi:SDR family oxidoreductase [Salipiger bermudensis]|uniref:SDR family oxidoreductase n=1 Tax=Salipiger bermudensis TaxID=344736 RepID=UPI001CD32122|nr:SDR family oxidoreductase [Salipiger bermudensis]MCA1283726.1 SDR family oxidoreductase [Salipiger bermudensis]